MIIVGSLTMASCYLGFAFAPGWEVCVPIMIVCGFGFYIMHNTLQTLATELAPDARGTAVGFFGLIIDRFGYSPAFILIAAAVACLGMWFQGKLAVTTSAAVTR